MIGVVFGDVIVVLVPVMAVISIVAVVSVTGITPEDAFIGRLQLMKCTECWYYLLWLELIWYSYCWILLLLLVAELMKV